MCPLQYVPFYGFIYIACDPVSLCYWFLAFILLFIL